MNSVHQLNIDVNLSNEISMKMEKNVGSVNLFDAVEVQIKNMLILDIIPRFKKSYEKQAESTVSANERKKWSITQ